MKKKNIFKVIASALCSLMLFGTFAACGKYITCADGANITLELFTLFEYN